MALLDNSIKYNNADDGEIRPQTRSISFSRETGNDLQAVTSNEHTSEIDDSLSITPSALHSDELPSLVNHKIVRESSSSSSFVDDLPIEDQPTSIIPAVPTLMEKTPPKAQGQQTQDYSSLVRKLVKSSGVYALASLTSPLVSLVLAPFLTHHLTRSQYGALAVLNTCIVLVSGVTQLGLGSAFYRAYGYDYESQHDRLNTVSTLLMLLLLITLPTAVVAFVIAPSLAVFLLGSPTFSSAVRVSVLVILVQNLSVPGLCWLRAETRAMFFSIVSIINLFVTAGSTVILVGVVDMGIEGALFATAAGYTVIVLCTLPMILLRAGVHLRFDIARGMLVFGFPYVLNIMSTWVLQLLDRYLLALLGSLAQAASYSVAYSLGGALSAAIIAPFSMAWWVMMYSIAKRDDALHVFQLIFRWFSTALLLGAFGLSTFGVIVLDLFFPASYHSAASIIPVISLSMVFNGISVVLSVGISLKRKTWLSTVSLIPSALLNVLLNLVLIPYYGAMGAAIATLISYAVLALIVGVINRYIYPVPFEIGRFTIATLIGIVLYVGSSFFAQAQQFYIAWALHIGGMILYGGCLALLINLPVRGLKHTVCRNT